MKRIALLLVVMTLGLAGCRSTGETGNLRRSGSSKDVNAEFDGLRKHSVAIVIHADESIQLNYPTVRMTIPIHLAYLLNANSNKRELQGITIMDPLAVMKFQDETLRWDTLDGTEIGRRLGVDYVLFISMTEYNMVEYGSSSMLRGRIDAQVKLYQTEGDGDGLVWESKEKDARVIYPASGAIVQASVSDTLNIRNRTERLFADKLIKKFYRHEVLRGEVGK